MRLRFYLLLRQNVLLEIIGYNSGYKEYIVVEIFLWQRTCPLFSEYSFHSPITCQCITLTCSTSFLALFICLFNLHKFLHPPLTVQSSVHIILCLCLIFASPYLHLHLLVLTFYSLQFSVFHFYFANFLFEGWLSSNFKFIIRLLFGLDDLTSPITSGCQF